MDLDRVFNSIGKTTFIKYYYNFKNKSRDACIIGFEEDYTDNAKQSRTSSAQRIFREGLQKEALRIIINSKVEDSVIDRAREILIDEI